MEIRLMSWLSHFQIMYLNQSLREKKFSWVILVMVYASLCSFYTLVRGCRQAEEKKAQGCAWIKAPVRKDQNVSYISLPLIHFLGQMCHALISSSKKMRPLRHIHTVGWWKTVENHDCAVCHTAICHGPTSTILQWHSCSLAAGQSLLHRAELVSLVEWSHAACFPLTHGSGTWLPGLGLVLLLSSLSV